MNIASNTFRFYCLLSRAPSFIFPLPDDGNTFSQLLLGRWSNQSGSEKNWALRLSFPTIRSADCPSLLCDCAMRRVDSVISNLTTWLIAAVYFPIFSQAFCCCFSVHSLYISPDERISINGQRFWEISADQRRSPGGLGGVRHRSVPQVSVEKNSTPARWRNGIINAFAFISLLFERSSRKSIELRGIDRSSKDDKYFRLREVNSSRVQILLKESLDDLVDSDSPHNLLKFKIQCNGASPSNRRNHDVRLWKFSTSDSITYLPGVIMDFYRAPVDYLLKILTVGAEWKAEACMSVSRCQMNR